MGYFILGGTKKADTEDFGIIPRIKPGVEGRQLCKGGSAAVDRDGKKIKTISEKRGGNINRRF